MFHFGTETKTLIKNSINLDLKNADTFDMRIWNVSFLIKTIFFLFGSCLAFANSPIFTTFQSKIVSPSGTELEAASVNFRFTILDSAGTCVLYVEDFNAVNMTGTKGIVSFPLGSGTKAYPPAAVSLYKVFDNSTPSFNCQAGGTYSPTSADNRQIVMQFNDGSGWQTLPQMAINGVPYANYATRAESLGDYAATSYLRPATLPTCTAGQAMTWDGTTFTCMTPAGGGGGVTSVTATAPVLISGGTSTPVVSLPKATASASGYLSSADWTTFNNKASSVVGAGKIYLGNASGDATGVSISGDATLASSGVLTLANSGVTSGSYGSGRSIPVFTIDSKGRVTSATTTPVAINSSDVTTALGYTPLAASSALLQNGNSISADLSAGTKDNFKFNFMTDNVNRMTIDTVGNVGIGTTSPSVHLEVPGTGTATTAAIFGNDSKGISIMGNWPEIGFNSQWKSSASNYVSLNTGYGALISSNQTSGGLDFYTATTVAGVSTNQAMTTRMRIDDSGNVGIGTTSPSRLLHVNGPLRVTASALPGSPGAGDIAVDSGDGNKLKWFDGATWLSVLGFGGEVNVSSTPYTITSSDNGKVYNYTNNANGVINLPALSSVSAGFSVVITREVAKTLTITPNGSDKFPGGVATVEMQGKNLQSVTVMKAGSTWKLVNQTEECTVGQDCWTADGTGGMKQLYVGTYKGKQYFTTPGGCTDSGTPTCAGGTDTVLKQWSSSATTNVGGGIAGNTATVLGTQVLDDATASCSTCGGLGQSAYLATQFTDTAAARYCENMNYAGYTDWYLPSKEELAFLYRNSASIGGFVYSSYYWSSTENVSTSAWVFVFYVGYATNSSLRRIIATSDVSGDSDRHKVSIIDDLII